MLKHLIYYMIFINITGLVVMNIDKNVSKIKGMTRVPERTLWFIAMVGGAIGTTIGMYMFRHKTRHILFKVGFPFIAILQIIVSIYMMTIIL